MDWETWKPHYHAIAACLGLNESEDQRATRILEEFLFQTKPEQVIKKLNDLLYNQIIVICGAGPSLDTAIRKRTLNKFSERYAIVAADGALEALYEAGIKCQIVVTDLDGDRGHLNETVKDGTIAVVHAHGDNIDQIKKIVPTLEMSNVIGSTQVQPTKHVFLWGGFTDGDRACYLATHFQPKHIILIGMDFGEVVGRWSKPGYVQNVIASNRKRLKLAIGEKLLQMLIKQSTIQFSKFDP